MKIGKIIGKMYDDTRAIRKKSCEQVKEILQEKFPEYKIEVSNYDQVRVRFTHRNSSIVDFILYATYDNTMSPQSMPRLSPRPRHRQFEAIQFPETEVQDIKIKLNKLYE